MLCKISGGSVRSMAPIRYVEVLPMHQNAEIEIHTLKKKKINRSILCLIYISIIPEDAIIGPQARANAPRERNIPVITPF